MALARTQLDQMSQAQNQKLLASMEHRARQQVHLSQAVEGLSVAAISYYGVGVINYALKGLPDIAIEDSTIVTLSVPVIIIIAFIFTRRARHHVLKIAEHSAQNEEI